MTFSPGLSSEASNFRFRSVRASRANPVAMHHARFGQFAGGADRLPVEGHIDRAAAAPQMASRSVAVPGEHGPWLNRMRQVVFFQPPLPSGRGGWTVIPVAPPVALADDEIDVVGKLLGIEVVKPPLPIVVAVAELLGAAVGDADLPELPAVAERGPGQLAEFRRLPRFHANAARLNSPSTPSVKA